MDWGTIELDSEKLICLYVPEGVGLGFQTLVDDSELFYQMTQEYVPTSARGIRWNDPKLKITSYKNINYSIAEWKLNYE